jgi:hypothetical protein
VVKFSPGLGWLQPGECGARAQVGRGLKFCLLGRFRVMNSKVLCFFCSDIVERLNGFFD